MSTKSMSDVRLLIVGASGLVGSNTGRIFSESGAAVLGTYFSYPVAGTIHFDTLDPNAATPAEILGFAPTHILHAGALTHVDYCESHPDESYARTVTSTLTIIELAKRTGARLIYISTDYVFDGKTGPYVETDHVNPLGIYARHKLVAEEAVLKEPNSLALRITNVYGDEERNKNFVARLIQAATTNERLEMRLPYDQYATPVNAADIGRALLALIREDHTGVYHIASTDYLNRVQLAHKVLDYFPGHQVSIIPVSTADLGQPAARPLYGGLKSHKFLKAFPEFRFSSVDQYVHEKLMQISVP